MPVEELFSGAAGWQDQGATLEGLEFEGEAGKAAELNPIGVTANSLAVARQTGNVSADSRKGLTADTLFTGEDESFAFTRAISRLCEMQSSNPDSNNTCLEAVFSARAVQLCHKYIINGEGNFERLASASCLSRRVGDLRCGARRRRRRG